MDQLTENARLRAALEAVVQFQSLTFTGPFAAHNKGRTWKDIMREAMSALATPAPDAVQEAARVLLAACPNPLFDRLKPIIMGEVTESIEYTDDVGNERFYKRHVSWTAMKETITLALRAIAGDHTAKEAGQ